MSQYERKEEAIRRILEGATPAVPPELLDDAVRRGSRALRRRTAVRRAFWTLLFVAAVVFVVWASVARPWVEPPTDTTPPLTRW
ncbi:MULTISPECIES: hypothetical protein [unclassified Streptomyces]|uniref:hypothetical protein n=1 Tax=unclassified Streptomyces TaxID=2593676 RepID=UPI0013720EA0|nr:MULTISPECIES: hypothetical protein [unclassified Streptomyces]NDZ98697.1 hypothetical protein [Streptomyces sp. SID10116]MYY82425.1 hypothetical protein [Streptomyces sp. SID335]MYZ15803.1 hypothetical protein [Streptomyces sp. SID337]NDZ87917.1 hypothetical protein [Streptomyces sp. SID10115]NEB45130.1 hypothetical protein [Streptomyces sp. SID339]